MKKVLFLDIDDVLNDGPDFDSAYGEMRKGNKGWRSLLKRCGSWIGLSLWSGSCSGKFIIGKRFGNTPVSVEKINRLKEIVKKTNCDIVGISSWFTSEKDYIEVSKLFGIHVMEQSCNTTGFGRYAECLNWLNNHPDYTHAVILDDIPMNVDGLSHIHVQPVGDGLTDELANDCINILNNPWRVK